MWGLPKEIVEAAARCNQWSYNGSSAVADYTDVLLVAEWHAAIGGTRSRRKPAIEEIPAFRRLGLQSSEPALGVKIVDAADQVIGKIEALLVA
jgi:HD-like signal output (HDOD) protein